MPHDTLRPLSNVFIVIPDTNVLRPNERPEIVVANGFTKTLQQLRKLGNLSLFVPSVVRDELVAQKLRQARRTRDELDRKAQTLGAITGINCDQVVSPDDQSLRAAIEAKFSQWANDCKASIIDTPTHSIDWRRLIDDAIHRVPPFEAAADDPKTENKEKGFRDALVLETAAHVETDQAEASVVLITKDELLKHAALKRLKSPLVFESLSKFESHLAQLHDDASEAFALQLAEAARQAWDTSKDSNLFDSLQIKELFQKEFAANLANPPRKNSQRTLEFSSHHNQGNVRIPLGDEVVKISSPEYLSEGSGRWNWRTEVELSQLFQRRAFHPESGLSPYVIGEDVRISRFIVFWDSAKDRNPVIIDPKFDHLLFRGIWLESPSSEHLLSAIRTTF